MNHLTDEQLAARLDGPRSGPQEDAAGQHLASCEHCRARLAELAALDADLGRVLDHDPGKAYFASFADRVSARIAAESAPTPARVAPEPRRGILAWWNSPRGLAWAGSTIALVAVAALGVMVSKQPGSRVTPPHEAASELDRDAAPQAQSAPSAGAAQNAPAPSAARNEAESAPQAAVPAPAVGGPLAAREMGERRDAALKKEKLSASPASPAPARAAAPERAMEVRTLPNGEQVAVPHDQGMVRTEQKVLRTPSGLVKPGASPMSPQPGVRDERSAPGAFAAAPPAAAPVPVAESRSMALAPPVDNVTGAAGGAHFRGGAAKAMEEVAADKLQAARVCGTVRDPRGHALAGVVLSVAETGASTTSGADGSFCLDAATAHATLEAFAVGYRAYRGEPVADDASKGVALTLLPVETLANNALLGRIAGGYRSNSLAAPGGDSPVRGLGTGNSTTAARTATADANRLRTVTAWQHAADEWTQLASRSGNTPAALDDARFHVAEARVNAWRLGHTAAERAAADAAISEYLGTAPAGPLRDLAAGWRKELAP